MRCARSQVPAGPARRARVSWRATRSLGWPTSGHRGVRDLAGQRASELRDRSRWRMPRWPADESAWDGGAMTGSDQCVETVLAVFAAVEHRDDAALARACEPDVEFCWPPSLPYGGTAQGLARPGEGWAAYWDRLQPTAALR